MVEEEEGGVEAAVAALPEPFRFRRLELSLALITFSVTGATGTFLRLFTAIFFSATTASVSLFCEKSLGDAEAGEKWWKVGRGTGYSASSSASWTPGPASSMASGLNQLLGWKLTSGGGEVGWVLLPEPESSPERKSVLKSLSVSACGLGKLI